MKLNVLKPDSLHVLTSTKSVVENSQYVSIRYDSIGRLSQLIERKIESGFGEPNNMFGLTGNFDKDIQLIFIQDVLNFCFWSEKGKTKWQIEWPKGHIVNGGWYNLRASLERALAEDKLLLDAKYLSEVSREVVGHIFRSATRTEMPLLQERQKNLQEAGQVLLKKYNGLFINLLEEARFDAVKVARLITQEFLSFRDISIYKKIKTFFLKRSLICAYDASIICKKREIFFTNLDQLTAFADYRLPQILREFEMIHYSSELASKVDNYELIKHDSREEIEIRASTIWSIELIRQRLQKYSASEIDNALWLLSQELPKTVKPHHRTYTIYY